MIVGLPQPRRKTIWIVYVTFSYDSESMVCASTLENVELDVEKPNIWDFESIGMAYG
jgi:hypothetical protein